jgi:hypothetical protein
MLREAWDGDLRLWLALDSIDVALWALALGGHADAAALIASPLAYEAGVAAGWRGLAVPAAVGTTANAAILLLGTGGPQPGPFLWPLAAWAMGIVSLGYLDRHLRHAVARSLRAIEGAAGEAELAGQAEVAFGADTVVDLLTRTIYVLGVMGGEDVPSRLASWRRALSDAGHGQATYLGVALTRWERVRNSRSPHLSLDVRLHVAEGAGALLLSATQAAHLEQALDGLDGLAGGVAVRVEGGGRRPVVWIGDRAVPLPVGTPPEEPVLDLGPVAFVLAGMMTLSQSAPWLDDVPLAVTGSLAAAALGLAWWSHRRVERDGIAAHGLIVVAALALSAADSVLATVTMGGHVGNGWPRLPMLLPAQWLGPLLLVYARDLGWRGLAAAIGCEALILGVSFALLHRSLAVTQMLSMPIELGLGVLVAWGLRELLDGDAARVGHELGRRYDAAVVEAFRRGRRLVVSLAVETAEDARSYYARARARLASEVAREMEARLAEADRQLAKLRD